MEHRLPNRPVLIGIQHYSQPPVNTEETTNAQTAYLLPANRFNNQMPPVENPHGQLEQQL